MHCMPDLPVQKSALLCNSFAKGVFHFPDKKDTHDARLRYYGKNPRMDAWAAIGFFLLGAAVGALLTRIASLGEIRRVKAEMEMREHEPSGCLIMFNPSGRFADMPNRQVRQ